MGTCQLWDGLSLISQDMQWSSLTADILLLLAVVSWDRVVELIMKQSVA